MPENNKAKSIDGEGLNVKDRQIIFLNGNYFIYEMYLQFSRLT